ncbi:MAG: hypothetical protein IKP60_13200 [Treponema sp.]|nr:hypothetical protein [Treponema sp.]
MVKGSWEKTKEWQNESFDNNLKKYQDDLLYSEVRRFAVFLTRKGIQIDDATLDEYLKERGFIK